MFISSGSYCFVLFTQTCRRHVCYDLLCSQHTKWYYTHILCCFDTLQKVNLTFNCSTVWITLVNGGLKRRRKIPPKRPTQRWRMINQSLEETANLIGIVAAASHCWVLLSKNKIDCIMSCANPSSRQRIRQLRQIFCIS